VPWPSVTTPRRGVVATRPRRSLHPVAAEAPPGRGTPGSERTPGRRARLTSHARNVRQIGQMYVGARVRPQRHPSAAKGLARHDLRGGLCLLSPSQGGLRARTVGRAAAPPPQAGHPPGYTVVQCEILAAQRLSRRDRGVSHTLGTVARFLPKSQYRPGLRRQAGRVAGRVEICVPRRRCNPGDGSSFAGLEVTARSASHRPAVASAQPIVQSACPWRGWMLESRSTRSRGATDWAKPPASNDRASDHGLETYP
jgi:hypothetical protein